MMTSRVEHRLLVRQDNADERLSPMAKELGLIDENNLKSVEDKYARIDTAIKQLSSQRVGGITGDALLRRPEVTLSDLEQMSITLDHSLNEQEREAVQIRVKYAGYIARVENQLRTEQKSRELSLVGVDFGSIAALSNEAREQLTRLQPQTIDQANRISGVRHADISALLVYLKRHRSAS